jgi:ATP-dependent DNA helicase PIF1
MTIEPNSSQNPTSETEAMTNLADHVYPDIQKNFNQSGWLDGRAILAPTNKQVDQLNDLITDIFPGDPVVLSSSDEVINPNDFQRYNVEYLNTLSTSGLPNHRLFIKPGMPLMLMRNLHPKMGLCNGTRLIFLKMHRNHLLECQIAGGEHKDRKVLIPRITLRPKDREFPFEWCRRQFPVRVAFAMTINKSQGQTLFNVGVWLNDPCFAHGQLYVCISRVGSSERIKFAIRKGANSATNVTCNVVFKEVLIDGML